MLQKTEECLLKYYGRKVETKLQGVQIQKYSKKVFVMVPILNKFPAKQVHLLTKCIRTDIIILLTQHSWY